MLTLNRAIEVLTCHFEILGVAGAIEKDAWQTLKAAVLAQQTNNSAMDAIVEYVAFVNKYSVHSLGHTDAFNKLSATLQQKK